MPDKEGSPGSLSSRSFLSASAVREEEIRLSDNLRELLIMRMLVDSTPPPRPGWKERGWRSLCRKLNLPIG